MPTALREGLKLPEEEYFEESRAFNTRGRRIRSGILRNGAAAQAIRTALGGGISAAPDTASEPSVRRNKPTPNLPLRAS